MKRNRFSEMVPPTPEAFHAEVLDALDRLPTHRRRRAPQGMVRIAASVAAVLAVGALLTLAIRLRPSPEDRVASPDEGLLPTVAPQVVESGVRLEIGDWSVDASGVSLDWSISGPEDETLLVRAQTSVTAGGEALEPFGVDLMDLYFALLGRDALGSGNGAQLTRHSRNDWQNVDAAQVVVTARVCVYRPVAEFVDDSQQPPESFEGVPKWLLGQYDEYVGAQPIDYYGRYEYQTPFGCDGMDAMLSALEGELFGGKAASPSMADSLELERILLETRGYAELVDRWEVVIDMSSGSGSGATEIRKIES